MPRRTDISSILIIGAGPIVIGQACEFDYSGTQACKALKAEGYRIILVNSNPATIMTDPDLADATYMEPITPEIVEKIIEKERPDALLPTMGGQTALNCALSLRKMGVLEKFGVEMIGATAEAIDKAEDRELFRTAMQRIGLETPRAAFVNTSELKQRFLAEHDEAIARIKAENPDPAAQSKSVARFEVEWAAGERTRREEHRLTAQMQALEASRVTDLPAIVRPSFTLAGTGGGIAYTLEELYDLVLGGVDASPTNEVLIEQSVLGWKEFEMEVVRDKADNCIIVCSIENIDPMGVHTGDSMTVAPALTLTDKEYQRMRDASIAVLREIGVETGGSNVQFAVNPEDGRLVVIEMNPRVSRSSALASKATGFPIAKVAARLAVGYTLDELDNDITGGVTPAAFEPAIDYVVVKVPRFAFEKFPGATNNLTTSMKSVGEAMAIGRTFAEALQKAMRSLETGLTGLNEIEIEGLGKGEDANAIRAALGNPTPDRLLQVAQAMRLGTDHATIFKACAIDPWFLDQIQTIIDLEQKVRQIGLPETEGPMRDLKSMGFSDARLAELSGKETVEVTALRHQLGVRPVYKRIDTCAGEFDAPTAYMYSSYEPPFAGTPASEARPTTAKKIVILGGGPNRIGQGIEFDYCCCHAAFALSDVGYETIMVNCNPETVSTDYDTSDRLYFEPLTEEDVLEILDVEASAGTLHGVIVQLGGQTPLGLAAAVKRAGVPILGTQPDAIDLAEDRDRFKKLLDELGLTQPANAIAYSLEQARLVADQLGYPMVIRPSYVLGGRAMMIVHAPDEFEDYIQGTLTELVPPNIRARYPNDKTGQINSVIATNPLLFDRYLDGAIEVDVDCLSDGKTAFVAGIMEHIEEAGIHSGDSACVLPPRTLSKELQAELEHQSTKMALALGVVGLMNVQYAIKDGTIYVLEVNPRASRTVPFVAKVIGQPVAKIGARIMAGEPLDGFSLSKKPLAHIAVKEAVFPFARFPGVDTVLGPEMRSTGEVIGLDTYFAMAFAKSQLGGGVNVPTTGTVFVSVRDTDKTAVTKAIAKLSKIGFSVLATGGTRRHLEAAGIKCERINKVHQGRPHIVDAMTNGAIDLVINTAGGAQAITDSRDLRRSALMQKIPYYTTIPGAIAAVDGILAYREGNLTVRPLQDYFAKAFPG
ncbi:MAG: carbamoyl-phosphate synthase large subunit [Alphaproteobacteria bacterium]|nr:carbamoyl-phosphate synthase large subunit [Alphaproteobacteria bacterium]